MSKSWKIALLAVSGVLGVVVVGAMILLLYWRGHTKAQLEAAASDALGMQVSIGGRQALQFFPSLGLTVEDVRIRNHGAELATARQARLGIELVSLLRRQVRIPTIALKHVTISVERGIAQAKDVAMTTETNRVALKGGLDFVNARYQDVTVAVVSPDGCSQVQQKVSGPFAHPDVQQPNVVTSLAGPALHLLKKARRALGGHCEVFYAGSLPPPQ